MATTVNPHDRIVITGVGLTAPNGDALEEFRAALLAGRSGVTRFETRYIGEVLAGVCRFDELKYQKRKEVRRGTRAGSIAVYCANEAVADSKLDWETVRKDRVGDPTPHIFRSTDGGRSWTRLVDGLRAGEPVRVVREDPARRGLLYAGTETGAFVSFDDGGRWQPLRTAFIRPAAPAAAASPSPAPAPRASGSRPEGSRAAAPAEPPTATADLTRPESRQGELPVVPVTDLVVHGDDLVASTQGRGFWILDDLTPLRQMSADVLKAKAHLFRPNHAVQWRSEPSRGSPYGNGSRKFFGQNPQPGAQLYYYLADKADKVSLKIVDYTGQTVRELQASSQPGFHRAAWTLTRPVQRQGESAGGRGTGPRRGGGGGRGATVATVRESGGRCGRGQSSSRGFIRRKIMTPIRARRPIPIPTITHVWPRKFIIASIEPSLSVCER